MNVDFSPFWISLKTAGLATVITVFLGIIAARWMFNYRGSGKIWLDGIFTLPLVLPPTVVGFGLLLLIGKNSPLQWLIPGGVNLIFTQIAAVIAATVVSFPLMYRTTLAALEQIDPNLPAAGRTFGATERAIFWQITLPLAAPGIVSGTILAFARALGEFGATLMVAGNIPGQTQTIPTAIFFAVEAGEMNLAALWATIISSISLLFIGTLNYWTQSGGKSGRNWRFGGYRSRGGVFKYLEGYSLLPFKLRKSPVLSISNLDRNSDPTTELIVDIHRATSSFNLDVNFQADAQPLGILGASGSGKSMTLRCLAGLITPTGGKIILNGRVLFDAQQKINLPIRQRRIGFVFQNYALFPYLTVWENIDFALRHSAKIRGLFLDRQMRITRIAKEIQRTHLHGLEHHYPDRLSGGQQQRVALARALITEPELLLLDEPFSALDSHLRNQIEREAIEILTGYNGVTILVSHNLGETYRLCDRLVAIDRGKTVATGKVTELFSHPPTIAVAQLTGCKNISRCEVIGDRLLRALDWNCTIQLSQSIDNSIDAIGIRAHHISIGAIAQPDNYPPNTYPCWLVDRIDSPFSISLYLKLFEPAIDRRNYHLEVEIDRAQWQQLTYLTQPWQLYLDPHQLFVMQN